MLVDVVKQTPRSFSDMPLPGPWEINLLLWSLDRLTPAYSVDMRHRGYELVTWKRV